MPSDNRGVLNVSDQPPGAAPPPLWSSDTDTAPQPVVSAPLSEVATGQAVGHVSSVLLVRAVVAAVTAAGLVLAAIWMFRHGVRSDYFPGYATGASRTLIRRYSGPWIGGAAGAALLATLAVTSCCADLWRGIRLRRERRPG